MLGIQNNNGCSLSIENKLSIISTCLSYSVYESNVYWQRNAIYVTINSVVFGLIAAKIEDTSNFALLVVCLFGVYFNFYWHHVNKYSKFFAGRWRQDAAKIIENDQVLKNCFLSLLDKQEVLRPKGFLPSQVMNNLALFFKYIWILGLVIVVLDILTEIPEMVTHYLKGIGIEF